MQECFFEVLWMFHHFYHTYGYQQQQAVQMFWFHLVVGCQQDYLIPLKKIIKLTYHAGVKQNVERRNSAKKAKTQDLQKRKRQESISSVI
jgi:hypothetical protein